MQPTFIPPVANRSKKRSNKKPLVIIAIIGVVLAIIAGAVLLLTSRSSSPTRDLNILNAQMTSVGDMIKTGRKYAKSADLVKIIGDAGIIISGDTTALTTATTAAGVKEDKIVLDSEKSDITPILADLQTAAIDGRFDRAFKTAFTEKLTAIQAQLVTVNEKSKRTDVRAATLSAHTHITNILDALSKLEL